tara:strand:+ start:3216 stop:3722 length:507 start_codon:yes stop_codon:yes gene_type:complete
MNKSDSIKNLAIALTKAQGELQNASKSSRNPHFKSTYANLSEVLSCVKESFTPNGLSFIQAPSFADGVVYVETLVMHISGEWISSTAGSPITKQTPQGIGDAVTYLRRYSLASVSGLAQQDDDGNAASEEEFTVDDVALQWIELARKNPQVLEQIKKPAYKEFIKANL